MSMIQPIAVVALIGVAVWFNVLHARRAAEAVHAWAEREGVSIAGLERRHFRKGPFWWRAGKHTPVFHVTVTDRQGRRRNAYVMVGGWFGGDHVTAEWEN